MWKALKELPKGWRHTLCPLTSSNKPEKTLNSYHEDVCDQHKDTDENSVFKKDAVPGYSSLSRPQFFGEGRWRPHLTWWKKVSSHKNFSRGQQFTNNFFEFLGFGFVVVAGLKFCRSGYFCNDDRKKKKKAESSLQWDALLNTWALQGSGLQRTVLPMRSALSESVSSDSDSFEEDDEVCFVKNEQLTSSSSSSSPLLQEHLTRLKDITSQYAALKLNEDALQSVSEHRLTEAVEKFRDASELGFDKAMFNLGVCYELGQGVEQDFAKACGCYERAAKVGHATASYNLAVFYLEGRGSVEVNKQEGLKWMERASDNGMKEAQTFLGLRCGQNKDYKNAVKLFKKAVRQRHSEAEYFLGLCYENGLGVEENLTEAAQLFMKSAEAGNVDACYNLAMYYERGLGGLVEDKNYAMDLYYQAATSGHPLAIKKLEFGLEDDDASSSRKKPPSKQEGIRAISSLPDMKAVMPNVDETVTTSSSLLDLTTVKTLFINYFEIDTTKKRKHYYVDDDYSNLINDCNTLEHSKIF